MTHDKKPLPKVTSPSTEGPPKAGSAFDVWLNRGLHKMFDDVANEPVPDELLKLIEDDREKK